MYLALFIALDSSLCFFAETADILDGIILPLSDTNLVKVFVSL